MRTILLIEDDALLRDLVSDHLQREGYTTCPVATPRIALAAARWTRFDLVLLDLGAASLCAPEQLASLRALGAPVVLMRTESPSRVVGSEGEIAEIVWSPFDLGTLTAAVHRLLPPPDPVAPEDAGDGLVVTSSGTFPVDRAMRAASDAELADDSGDRVSLDALSALVLEATGRRR